MPKPLIVWADITELELDLLTFLVEQAQDCYSEGGITTPEGNIMFDADDISNLWYKLAGAEDRLSTKIKACEAEASLAVAADESLWRDSEGCS